MPLLIDGHNLIARLPDMRLSDPDDEAKLVQRVRRYCFRRRRRATIVFDGKTPGGGFPSLPRDPVQVVFSDNADAVIRQRIRQTRDRRGLLVVSSDREVQAAAKRLGARPVDADAFAAELMALRSPAAKEKPEPADEVETWLHLFEP